MTTQGDQLLSCPSKGGTLRAYSFVSWGLVPSYTLTQGDQLLSCPSRGSGLTCVLGLVPSYTSPILVRRPATQAVRLVGLALLVSWGLFPATHCQVRTRSKQYGLTLPITAVTPQSQLPSGVANVVLKWCTIPQ